MYKIQSLGLTLPEGQERNPVIAYVCVGALELVRIRRACGIVRAVLVMAVVRAMVAALQMASAQVQAAEVTQS